MIKQLKKKFRKKNYEKIDHHQYLESILSRLDTDQTRVTYYWENGLNSLCWHPERKINVNPDTNSFQSHNGGYCFDYQVEGNVVDFSYAHVNFGESYFDRATNKQKLISFYPVKGRTHIDLLKYLLKVWIYESYLDFYGNEYRDYIISIFEERNRISKIDGQKRLE